MTSKDTLLDLARKLDDAYIPGLNGRIAAAIENKTALDAADQAAVAECVQLGEQLKPLLGDRYDEFERAYERLAAGYPMAKRLAHATLAVIGLADLDDYAAEPTSGPSDISGDVLKIERCVLSCACAACVFVRRFVGEGTMERLGFPDGWVPKVCKAVGDAMHSDASRGPSEPSKPSQGKAE